MVKKMKGSADLVAPEGAAVIASTVNDSDFRDGRAALIVGNFGMVTGHFQEVVVSAADDTFTGPYAFMGLMPLADPANTAIADAGGAYRPPSTVPPVSEADEHRVPYRRSPLRDGTALDGLVPDRPLLNSLLERSHLRKVEPPINPSTDFTRCRRFVRQLKVATETVVECDTFELAAFARTMIAPFHQPVVKEISARKLPYHIPGDPIDPVVIFVEAIPLAYCVLHQDACGNEGLDLDGVAYIVERLGEAECLQTHEQDIRFDVLRALSTFLAVIIAKAEEECWACVEAA